MRILMAFRSVSRTDRSDVRQSRASLLRAALLFLPAICGGSAAWAAPGSALEPLPDSPVLQRAMEDELVRSMDHLALEGLPRPYFIQYTAEDRVGLTLRGAYGAIVNADHERSRTASSRVRVGSYTLDNSNVGGGGRRAELPLDDDYVAIRHALWQITDQDYKQAVEVLTRKLAFLRDKTAEDRPDDFLPGEPVVHRDPSARMELDAAVWEENVRTLSGRFLKYPQVQNARVRFFAGAVNEIIVNTEGTRLRTADTGVIIEIEAQTQADDGMRLSDSLSYIGERLDQLPPLDDMLRDIDELCSNLLALAKAPVLEQYSGPVLFEPLAAARVFEALLAEDVCARPSPLGTRRTSASQSMEKKLGLRILPRSFDVYDDPTQKSFQDDLLAGSYRFDDEAVASRRVNVVENGLLHNMVASRSPTKKVVGSTGHGRSAGFGDAEARIGCLFIQDRDGIDDEHMLRELRAAAAEEGLEFALRIEALQRGGGRRLGNPVYAYRVNLEGDGEELVRGLEFQPVQTRALKRLLAAGSKQEVYNSLAGAAASIVSPAVIFDELDLHKVEGELDKPPILPAPALR